MKDDYPFTLRLQWDLHNFNGTPVVSGYCRYGRYRITVTHGGNHTANFIPRKGNMTTISSMDDLGEAILACEAHFFRLKTTGFGSL